MDTSIIQAIKKPWTIRRSIMLAILSLIIGGAIFATSYLGASETLGIGSFNQSILKFMLELRQSNLTNMMSTIAFFGGAASLAVITLIVAVIWASYKRELWRPFLLILGVGLSAVASIFLKSALMISRPSETSMVPPIEVDFAFPSSHTVCTVVFLLVAGYLICSRHSSVSKIITWIIATVGGTAIIAISRLYLGYHWLTDVVASIGLGLIIMAAIIFIDKAITSKFSRLQ
ncbi:MAG: phosphatase PAP2 family protein [Candidatus Saccharibacteria bacterium]